MTTPAPAPPVPNHPAKFSTEILDVMSGILQAEHLLTGRELKVLDPFAGVGRIHTLATPGKIYTVGVEIEQQWAAAHERTIHGDATILPFPDHTFDVVCTSPTYGNRIADRYAGDAKGSKRFTYRTSLGQQLHPRNTGGYNWGSKYKSLHWSAWVNVKRAMRDGGLGVVNVSNHIRKDEEVDVVGWHRNRWEELGADIIEEIPVETTRIGMGANRDARVSNEMILVFRIRK